MMRKWLWLVILLFPFTISAQPGASWAVFPGTLKLTDTTTVEAAPEVALHAARGEYAPFQVLGTSAESVPTVDFDPAVFEVNLYEQSFFPILEIPYPPIFTTAWLDAAAVADGLRPLGTQFTLTDEAGRGAAWVDLYVLDDAPAGDYTVTVNWDGGAQEVPITVYDVTLPNTGAASVIVPYSVDFTIPINAELMEMDDADYHAALNDLLIEHRLVPGHFPAAPVQTESGWDFSAYDEYLAQLPPNTYFHAPYVYDEANGEYFITDADGEPYIETDFSDSDFVAALTAFHEDLRDYLASQGRLEWALAYPIDETFWVADEPDNNGAEGYEHLANWYDMLNSVGLRVTASRVLPMPYAEGWPNGAAVTDDSHVHIDLLDSMPATYAGWDAQPEKSVSVYLNQYGDLIDLPASIHRGVMWHTYARDVQMVAGYAALEWVDADYNMVDPWTAPETVAPQFGYGVGALVYPDLNPSLRLKQLREGVEDAELLDLYAAQQGEVAARDFAACLTPQPMMLQNPPADLWDNAHAALLAAVANNATVDTSVCAPVPNYTDTLPVISSAEAGEWEQTNVELTENDASITVNFMPEENSLFYWMGVQDWSGYNYLLIDLANNSDALAGIDVAIGDDPGNYLLLTANSVALAPGEMRMVVLPLVVPRGVDRTFDLSQTTYIDLAVSTSVTRRNGAGEVVDYDIGGRTITIGDIRLAR